MKSLDMNIIKNKKRKTISMEEALKDTIPIKWSDEILNGDKKIIVNALDKDIEERIFLEANTECDDFEELWDKK